MIRKYMKYIMSALIMFWLVWSLCNAGPTSVSLKEEFPFQWPQDSVSCNSTNLSDCVDINEDSSVLGWLLGIFWLKWWAFEWDHKFLTYVRAILNLAVSLISVVALIMTIYTFYMIFFSDNEAWIKKAKWNLVWIFIALAVIWLAWLIVSVIFWWYQKHWSGYSG